MDPLARRALGAYYTPSRTSGFLARWVLQRPGMQLLEPSFGDGAFLQAVHAVAAERGWPAPRITGAEISELAFRQSAGLVDGFLGDFLAASLGPVDGVLGNPPFVRLRHLPAPQRAQALATSEQALGRPMEPGGSVWMAFVLHCTRALRTGGRLALVLPAELAYVRYARPLWQHLGASFGCLRVLRCRERLFDDLLQDVVLLLADERGGSTTTVGFEAYETVDALVAEDPCVTEQLAVGDVVAGKRVFLQALLPTPLRELLDGRLQAQTVPARDLVTFNIGYVTGDKAFFHPGPDQVRAFSLPDAHLRPTVISARRLRGGGLFTSSLPASAIDQLYLPGPALGPGEQRYVEHGRRAGVAQRYKCRIRDPWWVVPGVKSPDLLLSVFSEQPVLLANDAGFVASNSLLCGYGRDVVRTEDFVQAWYTSLTLLQVELQVHSLGGGVLVLVPGEAGSIRIPAGITATDQGVGLVHQRLAAGDPAGAYAVGDDLVLRRQLGLSDRQIALVREGAAVLRRWRLSSRGA